VTFTPTPIATPTVTPTASAAPCGGALTVGVSGTILPNKGQSYSFVASVAGGTPPYRYFWSCDFNITAPVLIPDAATTSCRFPLLRPFIVEARVSDANNVRGYCGVTVIVLP